MGNYQRINPRPTKGIENKKAYLIGSGIGSLAAAEYLIRDGHMNPANITIFESGSAAGGAMDGAGNPEDGYIARGGRELEEHYECMWDLFGKIPSIDDPNRTILEEFKEINDAHPNIANVRLLKNRGEKIKTRTLGLKKQDVKELRRLFLATEEELGATTVEEYFNKGFFETDFWLYWRSMFAFQTWHSVVEMKRYMNRFIHLMPGMSSMQGILFGKYNQYDGMILPLLNKLLADGIKIEYNTTVTDLDFDTNHGKIKVTAIHLISNGEEKIINTTENDLVFFTNGSMTESSTYGDMNTAPELSTSLGGSFGLWTKIAKKSDKFGRPEVFISEIDKTKWMSFTITAKGDKFKKLIEHYGEKKVEPLVHVTGGPVTIKDSNWLMSFTSNKQPQFLNQPEDVMVSWAYGLFPDKEGNFIKKKMSECTGKELLMELLYHLGVEEKDMQDYLNECKVRSAMMPYITSQFMPRVKGDRPDVIPEGSVNFAFLGQFAEIPEDCVFTVEYSVRSAIMAVYGLLNIDKQVPEVFPSKYDVRYLAASTKTMLDGKIPGERIIKKILANTAIENLI